MPSLKPVQGDRIRFYRVRARLVQEVCPALRARAARVVKAARAVKAGLGPKVGQVRGGQAKGDEAREAAAKVVLDKADPDRADPDKVDQAGKADSGKVAQARVDRVRVKGDVARVFLEGVGEDKGAQAGKVGSVKVAQDKVVQAGKVDSDRVDSDRAAREEREEEGAAVRKVVAVAAAVAKGVERKGEAAVARGALAADRVVKVVVGLVGPEVAAVVLEVAADSKVVDVAAVAQAGVVQVVEVREVAVKAVAAEEDQEVHKGVAKVALDRVAKAAKADSVSKGEASKVAVVVKEEQGRRGAVDNKVAAAIKGERVGRRAAAEAEVEEVKARKGALEDLLPRQGR